MAISIYSVKRPLTFDENGISKVESFTDEETHNMEKMANRELPIKMSDIVISVTEHSVVLSVLVKE